MLASLIRILILLVAAAFAVLAEPAPFSARVISIADGDTITVLRDNTPTRVRLFGIDCPEKKQPYSARAKEFTSDLAFGQTVTIESRGRDRYGRTIGIVRLPDGRVLNHELVRAGLAWWFRKYAPRDETRETLESAARTGRRGLWADAEPVAPWEWRRRRGEAFTQCGTLDHRRLLVQTNKQVIRRRPADV